MKQLSISITTASKSSSTTVSKSKDLDTVAESLSRRVANFGPEFDETLVELAGPEVASLVSEIDVKINRLRSMTLRNPKLTRDKLDAALKALGDSNGAGTMRNAVLEQVIR